MPRGRSPTAVTVKIQKHFTEQDRGEVLLSAWEERRSGWSEERQQEQASGTEGKLESIKEKFLLSGCTVAAQGNTVQPESLKPWLGRATEDVGETELESGLVWWWDQKAHQVIFNVHGSDSPDIPLLSDSAEGLGVLGDGWGFDTCDGNCVHRAAVFKASTAWCPQTDGNVWKLNMLALTINVMFLAEFVLHGIKKKKGSRRRIFR